MPSPALTLDFGAAALVQRRCRAIAGLLGASEAVSGTGELAATIETMASILGQLWESGRLAFDAPQDQDSAAGGAIRIRYIAGDTAVRAVVKAEDPTPTSSGIAKRHRKQARTSPGAIFRFPLEAQDSTLVDVFITDWSPCPAGCAVAVHRDHPILRQCEVPPTRQAGNAFAGLYARHPLTGDLLPVWVADWVKPDFGTGAVLVNPAHDEVDLQFARRIGLPIRFALSDQPDSDDPEAWQTPPVIYRGQSVKTGLYDGLDPATARQRYFDVLESRGLAYSHTDAKLPSQDVARVEPDANGAWLFNEETGRLRRQDSAVSPGACERRVTVVPSGGLLAAAVLQSGTVPTLIVPYSEIDGEFLAFRLLCGELGIEAASQIAPVYVNNVEGVQPGNEGVDSLTLLVAGNPEEQAVIKQQVSEKVETFLSRHRDLATRGEGEEDRNSQRQAQDIAGYLRKGQAGSAFAALYKWQKDLYKTDGPPPPGYHDVAGQLVAAADKVAVPA